MTQGMPELPQPRIMVPLLTRCLLEIDKIYHHWRKRWRPGAVAITENSAGKILLVRSTKSRRWSFPQGGIGRHEGVIRGLVRELHEETGVVASEVRLLCLRDKNDIPNWSRDGFTRGKRYYYFLVRCEGVPEVTLQRDEVCDYQWLLPQRAEEIISAAGGEEYRRRKESMLTALGRATR